ncbi:hypothetical protein GYB22_07465 [bacterium]|nr:hypothetical protein [bacterium]
MKTFLASLIIIAAIHLGSCTDKTPAPGPAPDPQDSTPVMKTNTELLCIKWIVDEAYVDGSTPDNSSKGLKIEFFSTNDYRLTQKNGSTFDGTWFFDSNETVIEVDKQGQFPQTWNIQTLDENKLDVKFVSPFTQQNAQWIMIPQ